MQFWYEDFVGKFEITQVVCLKTKAFYNNEDQLGNLRLPKMCTILQCIRAHVLVNEKSMFWSGFKKWWLNKNMPLYWNSSPPIFQQPTLTQIEILFWTSTRCSNVLVQYAILSPTRHWLNVTCTQKLIIHDPIKMFNKDPLEPLRPIRFFFFLPADLQLWR